MDKNLYNTMDKILAEHPPLSEETEEFKHDIIFIGSITSEEKMTNRENDANTVTVIHDIFMIVDKKDDITIEKFFDETGKLIAWRGIDGELYIQPNDDMDTSGLLEQIDSLCQTPEEHISLNEMNKELDEIAEKLGITRAELLATSSIPDQDILTDEKQNENEQQLDLSETGEQTEAQKEKNEEALDAQAKQELDTYQKVDDKHTLAEILGLETGSKLIVVYSTSIANNPNSTRFSFVVKKRDGTIAELPEGTLTQVGGKDSDRKVSEMSNDELENVNVSSTYRINTDKAENLMINVRQDSMGRIITNYGMYNPNNQKEVLAHTLKTDRDSYTSPEVLEQFRDRGAEEEKARIAEADLKSGGKGYENSNDLDGNLSTGAANERAIKKLLSNPTISSVYSENDVRKFLNYMIEKYPDKSFDDIVSLSEDSLSRSAEFERSQEHHPPRM